MISRGDPAVAWLLADGDPAVRALVRQDLLGEDVPAGAGLDSPIVRGLLAGRQADGTWPGNPYRKWTGGHWRLVSLVEIGVPPGHPDACAAAGPVLDYWAGRRRLGSVPVVEGKARRCASQEGNALAVGCRLGFGADERAHRLAEHLVAWQWPDGGWNCDRRPEAHRSSFHETWPALWGLHEYVAATGEAAARDAVARAAELVLSHDVVFSTKTGEPMRPAYVEPHYPPYWRFDVLQGLLVLTRAGHGGDPRTARARRLVAERRGVDGLWRAGRRWWKPPGAAGGGVEAVDWGEVADQMVTLNALRVGAGG